jgi:hypothetical protein
MVLGHDSAGTGHAPDFLLTPQWGNAAPGVCFSKAEMLAPIQRR